MKILMPAGGQGTKVWPFSRKSKPKQFQQIVGDESLFTHNINMLLTRYPPEDIFVSTKKMYLEMAQEQAPAIPKDNYIVEPDAARGRGAAEGFAFLKLSILAPNEPFTIIQSDCIYLPPEKYLDTIEVMEKMVRKEKKLISGGLAPTYPILGVDFIHLGEKVIDESGVQVHKVVKFLGRKENYDETAKLIKDNNVVIHTNLNTWYPELMLEAYKKHRPDWYDALMQIKEVLDDEGKIEEIYSKMDVDITEAVTRKVFEEGYIVTYPFKWVDIGTWDSVYEYLSKDESVYTEGNVIVLNSEDTLVKSTNPKKLVAVLGLKDMVVVDTEDILFVAPRDKVSNIKEVHEELKNKGLEDYL